MVKPIRNNSGLSGLKLLRLVFNSQTRKNLPCREDKIRQSKYNPNRTETSRIVLSISKIITGVSPLLSICSNGTVKCQGTTLLLVTNFTSSIKLLITITSLVATLVLNVSTNEQNLKFVYNPILNTRMPRPLMYIIIFMALW